MGNSFKPPKIAFTTKTYLLNVQKWSISLDTLGFHGVHNFIVKVCLSVFMTPNSQDPLLIEIAYTYKTNRGLHILWGCFESRLPETASDGTIDQQAWTQKHAAQMPWRFYRENIVQERLPRQRSPSPGTLNCSCLPYAMSLSQRAICSVSRCQFSTFSSVGMLVTPLATVVVFWKL